MSETMIGSDRFFYGLVDLKPFSRKNIIYMVDKSTDNSLIIISLPSFSNIQSNTGLLYGTTLIWLMNLPFVAYLRLHGMSYMYIHVLQVSPRLQHF